MDSPLSPETQNGIRALCGEIAVAHELDSELREELCGHIEDKTIGYLSGEEAVSEPDALLLAREHFGDRARLKAMLSEVHRAEHSASFWRRMAAGLVVMLGLFQALILLRDVPVWLGHYLGLDSVEPGFPTFLTTFLVAAVLPLLMWWILARWKAALRRGEEPWFIRWRPAALVVCVAGALASFPLVAIVATLSKGLVQAQTGLPSHGADWPLPYNAALWAVVLGGFVVLMPALWMWWCDERPRSPGAMRSAVLVWSLSVFYSVSVANMFGFASRGETVFDRAPVLLELSDGVLVLIPLFSRMTSPQVGGALGLAFLYGVGDALLGWVAYRTARAARTVVARR